MANYSYLKKFVEQGSYQDAETEKMTENYNLQYEKAVSSFDILINSDRANNIYRDNILYKAIVDYGNSLKKGELKSDKYTKEVRTRHSDNFKGGNVVEFENKGSEERQTYLFLKNIETKDEYDLSVMQECNNTLILKGEVTKTKVGENDFGEPQYSYVEGDPIEIPCIVETSIQTRETEKPINLPEGRLQVTIPYTDNKQLAISQEFSMYDSNYEIIGIDYTKSINGVGIMIIDGKRKV